MTTSNQGAAEPQTFAPGAPSWTPLPIVSIGAGGIVHDSHLPAYRKAGFPVIALIDPDREKAGKLAAPRIEATET